ncbi:universal stress protein [Desulfurella sp.]|uniref:universal stress protein n=1 Tax=Desulfurella sp. TaxID=1962857 RepID=UPI0025C1D3A2|nr:universal stress protein [Desulfurella sp.]
MYNLSKLLVAVDSSPYSTNAIKFALDFGKKFNCIVDALHVIDTMQLEGPFIYDLSGVLGFEPFINFSAELKKTLEEKGRSILQAFSEMAQNENVKFNSFIEVGIIPITIVETSYEYDMVFIGKKGINASFERGILGSNIESTIRKIKKPIFVADKDFYEIKNIVVGYDAREPAKEALELANALAGNLKAKIHIVNVRKTETENLEDSDLNIIYLTKQKSVADTLIEYTKNLQNPLLILGAYNKNRLLEMIIGSTTEAILRKECNLPLIIVR